MNISQQEVTSRTILLVLLAGFGLVILLLLAAGYAGIRSIRAIQENVSTLVEQQQQTANLVDEIQSEQKVLSAVFYHLARGPELADREKILQDLDTADREVVRIASQTKGTTEEPLGDELRRATEAFTQEARRLLALPRSSSLLSRDLFEQHRRVTNIVARLIDSGRAEAQAAQCIITEQSRQLFYRMFVLLSVCLGLAVLFSLATVRLTTGLFRKMEWQAGELSRVSWHLLQNQESVARRFSHELHDELGQTLTALKASILALTGSAEDGEKRKECLHLVDGALRNVRELSQLLRPTILDDFGLDASLRWLAERFSQHTGIEVAYNSDFTGRLEEDCETHLFRIAQEALTNVARHSRAKRVEIELRASGAQIRLRISDDGVGLSPDDRRTQAGLGMIGMRARARSVGGELKVRSQPGAGVTIEVALPAKPVKDVASDTSSSC